MKRMVPRKRSENASPPCPGNSLEGLVSTESPIWQGSYWDTGKGTGYMFEVNSSYGYYVVVRSIRKTIDDGSDKIRSF